MKANKQWKPLETKQLCVHIYIDKNLHHKKKKYTLIKTSRYNSIYIGTSPITLIEKPTLILNSQRNLLLNRKYQFSLKIAKQVCWMWSKPSYGLPD